MKIVPVFHVLRTEFLFLHCRTAKRLQVLESLCRTSEADCNVVPSNTPPHNT